MGITLQPQVAVPGHEQANRKNTRNTGGVDTARTHLVVGQSIGTFYTLFELHLESFVLLVSLLDGQVVALKFGVPDELGHLLKTSSQAKRYWSSHEGRDGVSKTKPVPQNHL